MHTFSQKAIDPIRMRVLFHLVRAILDGHTERAVRHLWFPEENLDLYIMRKGNPPADDDRPNHLKGLRLHIDPEKVPDWIVEYVKTNGKIQKEIENRCHELGLRDEETHSIINQIFERFAQESIESGYNWGIL